MVYQQGAGVIPAVSIVQEGAPETKSVDHHESGAFIHEHQDNHVH